MKPSAILESALYVTDLDAARVFYGQVLGLELITEAKGRHAFYRCGAGVLLLFVAEETKKPSTPGAGLPVPSHGAVGQGHLCFSATAAEIDHWRRRLEDLDIAIEADFVWPSGGRSIYLRDPSGNSLEFAEPRIWGFE